MFRPKYVMFFDFHTQKTCPDVGHAFDAEVFAGKLKSAGVDLIGFHAKCNQGFCYYDTKIGIRHPALEPGRDLFGEVVEACARRNIRVTAYFNCGLSNETAIEHPEWAQINPAGSILHPEIEGTNITPYMRLMCINSPWRKQLMEMVAEVYAGYPVAGFLFDSFNGFPCVCPHCVEGMHREGMNPLDTKDVERFAAMSALRLGEELSQLIEPQKNHLLFNCLGLSSRQNARLGTYLECECLPTVPCWGYDWLPIAARSLRRLTDGPVLNMTGRFYDWGDFGTLRTDAAIEYDLFLGLANGMRPNIGDHLHPRGDLHDGIFDAVKRIYDKIRRYDDWYANASNPVDMAVVHPKGDWKESLIGAERMLSELKAQFDVVDFESDWSQYKLLVLPDSILLDAAAEENLKKFLHKGGRVIATGKSGLNEEEAHFCFESEWGAKYLGPSCINPPYFRLSERYADRVADLPQSVGAGGFEVRPLQNAEIAGVIVAPYYNKHWDGLYSYYYTPPDRPVDTPFLLFGEQVVYCPWRLFAGYYNAATPDLRNVFELMLKKMLPEPLIKCDSSLPSFARAVVSEQPGARNVHLLNFLPELRGKMLIVEEAFSINNVKVQLRTDGREVARVILAPEKTELPFKIEAGYVCFTVPELRGYALASVEFK